VPRLGLVQIDCVADLRAAAPAWDDLWWRSDATLPTLRAELLAQWIEQFAPRADFRALVVVDQGQWVAALPLVRRAVARLFPAGTLPANQWSSSGDLLLDADARTDAVLDLLVSAVRELPWPLLWLDAAPLDAPRWLALHQALLRAGIKSERRVHYQVARIKIGHDWQAYRQSWSRKHRQKMSWSVRHLEQQGGLQLESLPDLPPEQVEPWLQRGFEVEDRGWKGREGTSVLRTPRMFPFLVRQARQLAHWGQLELEFLQCAGGPIAFAYGMSAKGVFHSCKIGYDPDYAAYSPGQLLRYFMLERFHGDPQRCWLDCQGPLSDAHAAWRPEGYPIGRLMVAPRRLLGRALLCAYRYLWSPMRRLCGRSDTLPAHQLDAEPQSGRVSAFSHEVEADG
jgi:CelD/BcsL family acetyltransferase involved in cellulose biosynthesis